jgi:hypothetical protein
MNTVDKIFPAKNLKAIAAVRISGKNWFMHFALTYTGRPLCSGTPRGQHFYML